MLRKARLVVASAFVVATLTIHAAVITVTTTNNPGPGSLSDALYNAQAGDTIQFNIAGNGPHRIATPPNGYPYITADNLTIDGYSQPGSSPNTNTILAANTAKIQIVLDSRNGNTTVMNFPGDTENDDTGYGGGESAILGIIAATNVDIAGLCLLGPENTGADGDISVYGISFAKGANGHVHGCWIGVDVTGQSGVGYGPADAITGFRYRGRDENNVVTNTILVSGVTIGVGKTSSNPRAEFNVISSIPEIPIIIEGENTRISGNFINVAPDGLHDYNPAFDERVAGNFEGNIEIGRAGNNTVIGTDGDGVNDAEERNVFSGVLPPSMKGYDHNLEFYGQNPGTNVVVAGNYFGVGVDGTTRFTNGVPALNATGGSAQYRFGSDLDGVSDNLEGNVVYNNWPSSLFPASTWDPSTTDPVPATDLNFFDELSTGAQLSARGNLFVDNFPFPVSPVKADGGTDGAFLTNYMAKVLADPANGINVVLSLNSTTTEIIGTVPVPSTNYPTVMLDLYTVDPEGLTNGKAAKIPELPYGFIQGKTFLGTYPVTAANGSFNFSISSLNIPVGAQLTATANYSSAAPKVHNAPTVTSPFAVPVSVTQGTVTNPNLSVARSGNNVVLSWTSSATGFLIQSSAMVVPSNWQDMSPQPAIVPVGDLNTASIPIGTGTLFYRLKK